MKLDELEAKMENSTESLEILKQAVIDGMLAFEAAETRAGVAIQRLRKSLGPNKAVLWDTKKGLRIRDRV